jgi:hypothetical protein
MRIRHGNALSPPEGTVHDQEVPSSAFKDLVVILVLSVLVFAVSAAFDVFDKVIGWVYAHDTWQLDELFTVGVYLAIAMAVYAWRRHQELLHSTTIRKQVEAEKARLLPALERARADVTDLKKLIPICSSCGKLRDDQGYWNQLEEYLETHLHAKTDAGLCPECARKLYGPGGERFRPGNRT